ncbi:hypothetical protein E2C01_034237 [Portunus trituberculatus]|uniref:Uncharacterized protein n=1 Tax=Portunus trituberculatus TaxID=210409 RepID=A0A5B7F0X0_PORTR|nr:hypothetical protein [Portunus trituberculatus]
MKQTRLASLAGSLDEAGKASLAMCCGVWLAGGRVDSLPTQFCRLGHVLLIHSLWRSLKNNRGYNLLSCQIAEVTDTRK